MTQKDPAGHVTQDDAPVEDVYVPAVHDVIAPFTQ